MHLAVGHFSTVPAMALVLFQAPITTYPSGCNKRVQDCQFIPLQGLNILDRPRPLPLLTLTFLSSAVVSSNSTPSLKLTSVVLKVLWVFTVIVSPFISMTVVGLVILATCLVAKPTPEGRGKVMSRNRGRIQGAQWTTQAGCGKEARRG